MAYSIGLSEKYRSIAWMQEPSATINGEIFVDALIEHLVAELQHFATTNGDRYPEQIVVYRGSTNESEYEHVSAIKLQEKSHIHSQ